MINKSLPCEGLNIRIPIIIPIMRRRFITHGFGVTGFMPFELLRFRLGHSGLPVAVAMKGNRRYRRPKIPSRTGTVWGKTQGLGFGVLVPCFQPLEFRPSAVGLDTWPWPNPWPFAASTVALSHKCSK